MNRYARHLYEIEGTSIITSNMYTVCRVNYLQAILGTEQQLRVGGGGGAGRREVVEPESTCLSLEWFFSTKNDIFSFDKVPDLVFFTCVRV